MQYFYNEDGKFLQLEFTTWQLSGRTNTHFAMSALILRKDVVQFSDQVLVVTQSNEKNGNDELTVILCLSILELVYERQMHIYIYIYTRLNL